MAEQVVTHLPEGAQLGFYRTAGGAEMNLVARTGPHSPGLEIRFLSAPTVSKGCRQARDDLKLRRTVVVAPAAPRFPLRDGVEVVPVSDFAGLLGETR